MSEVCVLTRPIFRVHGAEGAHSVRGVAGGKPRIFSKSCACEVTPSLRIADINKVDTLEVERPNR
jgi:hypothetical protein